MGQIGNALAVRNDEAERELTASIEYARQLSSSNLIPDAYQGKPQNVLVAIEHGRSIGIAPITAINLVHVIKGKPTASAQLMGALVRRAGHRLRVTWDGTTAVATVNRTDDPDFTFTAEWTLDRARHAGLAGSDTYKKFGSNMLKARAISEVVRDACPEVLAGLGYTPDELGATDVPVVLPPTDDSGEVIDDDVLDVPDEDVLFDSAATDE